MHYNGHNSNILADSFGIYKFKAKDAEMNADPTYLGNVLKDFSVDHNCINVDEILNSMAKYGNKSRLSYTDSDTLLYEIETKHIFKTILVRIKKLLILAIILLSHNIMTKSELVISNSKDELRKS